jgi:hypothetical protein
MIVTLPFIKAEDVERLEGLHLQTQITSSSSITHFFGARNVTSLKANNNGFKSGERISDYKWDTQTERVEYVR